MTAVAERPASIAPSRLRRWSRGAGGKRVAAVEVKKSKAVKEGEHDPIFPLSFNNGKEVVECLIVICRVRQSS